jgi:3-hydroxyisobutyrate dehydrogenase
MAGRILSAQFPLTVYNRNPERTKPFVDRGATAAASPREAAANAEIIISIVADDNASRAVWLGENGALSGAKPGTVLIESGTLTVNWIKELAAAAAAKNCELLDAPVTGTKPHAAAGELIFLVGGSAKALATATPVLECMSRSINHLGPTGSGSLMKLINNFMAGVQVASFAEASALIDAGGLDHEKAVAVLTNGAPGSPLVKRIAETIAGGDFTPNFMVRLMAKDLAYASGEAKKDGFELQTAAGALGVFKEAIARGHGEEDFSAVVKAVRPGQ